MAPCPAHREDSDDGAHTPPVRLVAASAYSTRVTRETCHLGAGSPVDRAEPSSPRHPAASLLSAEQGTRAAPELPRCSRTTRNVTKRCGHRRRCHHRRRQRHDHQTARGSRTDNRPQRLQRVASSPLRLRRVRRQRRASRLRLEINRLHHERLTRLVHARACTHARIGADFARLRSTTVPSTSSAN